MGCATSQTEDKPEFLDVGDVLVQFDPTAGGATPSTFQAIRVKVLRANKLIKADSKGSHQSLFVLPSLSLPPPTLPTLSQYIHASIHCLRPAHHTADVHEAQHTAHRVVRSSTPKPYPALRCHRRTAAHHPAPSFPPPFTAAAVIGKSDPYAVVRVGATGHSFHEKGEAGAHESTTKTINNNEDPVWDEEFTLAYDVVRSRQCWYGVVAVGTRRRADSRPTSSPVNMAIP